MNLFPVRSSQVAHLARSDPQDPPNVQKSPKKFSHSLITVINTFFIPPLTRPDAAMALKVFAKVGASLGKARVSFAFLHRSSFGASRVRFAFAANLSLSAHFSVTYGKLRKPTEGLFCQRCIDNAPMNLLLNHAKMAELVVPEPTQSGSSNPVHFRSTLPIMGGSVLAAIIYIAPYMFSRFTHPITPILHYSTTPFPPTPSLHSPIRIQNSVPPPSQN